MTGNQPHIVAYFDFDGTLTTHDTFIPFLIHTVGLAKFLTKLPRALVILVLYLTRIIDNHTAKERTLFLFVRGLSRDFLDMKSKSFARDKISRYIRPLVFSRLLHHQEHGTKVILVSANLALYLCHWAEHHGIHDVIATEIEFRDGLATGLLATHNCYGPHKIIRVNQYLEETGLPVSYSYAYGNSRGDHELLDFACEAFWVSGDEIITWEERRADR